MEVGEKVRNGDILIELYYIIKVQYIFICNLIVWIVFDQLIIFFFLEYVIKKRINY